jgi:N6-L-threonylcarbamoyladenine synthase
MTTRILGIESSCDETAAAVVADGREILSNVVASQVDVHRKYGGVVPELASREHLRHIVPVVREALERAGMRLADVDAIGVTRGPGLVGALLVGLTYGKVLAQALGKPLVAVNHLEGHVHAVLLEAYRANTRPEFPAVCLIVSGGHTLLYRVEAAPAGAADSGALDLRYRRLGGTRDDAAGEAYDKVARWLGLGYPGGPEIDRLADEGSSDALKLPVSMIGDNYDLSFSGLKTAVVRATQAHPEISLADVAASFQAALAEQLLRKLRQSLEHYDVKGVALAGGVAANSALRAGVSQLAKEFGLVAHLPTLAMCTDNAAMIAAAGVYRLSHAEPSELNLSARPNWHLADVS